MALLVFVTANEEGGACLGTGKMEREDPSSLPRYFLNQKLARGFGGLEPHHERPSTIKVNWWALAGDAGVLA